MSPEDEALWNEVAALGRPLGVKAKDIAAACGVSKSAMARFRNVYRLEQARARLNQMAALLAVLPFYLKGRTLLNRILHDAAHEYNLPFDDAEIV